MVKPRHLLAIVAMIALPVTQLGFVRLAEAQTSVDV
jgi:hypothetical protein